MSNLEIVQNYLTKDGTSIKEAVEKKHYPRENKWLSNGDWVFFVASPTRSFSNNKLTSHAEYGWRVENSEIVEISGHAQDVTPEFEPNHKRVEENKKKVAPKELDIHSYFNQQLLEHPEDKAVEITISHFGITEDEFNALFERVENTLYPQLKKL